MEGAQLVQSTKTVSSTEGKLHRSIWLPINPRVHQQLLQKICKVSFSALHDNDLWSKLQGCEILLLSPWWGWDDLKFSVPMQYWCNSFVLVHAAKTNKKPCAASYDQEKNKTKDWVSKTIFFFYHSTEPMDSLPSFLIPPPSSFLHLSERWRERKNLRDHCSGYRH